MKKILLLGVILAAVLFAGCNKEEGYDSLESLTYTAEISDTWTESYRFISENEYEHVVYNPHTGSRVANRGRYTYNYPTLKIYSHRYADDYYTTMKFQSRNMFKYRFQVIATSYTPWNPEAAKNLGLDLSGSVEYQTYKFFSNKVSNK